MFRWKTALGLVVLLAGPSPRSLTVQPAAAEEASDSELDLDALKEQLESGNEKTILSALAAIADKKDERAAPLVNALLRRGGTIHVLEEAMRTVGKLKTESSSAAVAPYVHHRTDSVRRAAIRTLLKTKGPAAVRAMRQGLRSQDAMVRGIAATGLGSLGAHEALEDLFKALDHGVAEAAASIGQLCKPEECEKFADRTGKVGLDVMTSGFDQILFRPPDDMPDDQKIRIIGRLRELGTPEAGKYLATVAERWPDDWSKKVKQALESAARATGGGS